MQNINDSYNPRIEELRGIACLLVFFTHSRIIYSFFGNDITVVMINRFIGHIGVIIFFILSGYLFTTIFLNKKEPINYKNFIYNRFLRIFPLYFFYVWILCPYTKYELTHIWTIYFEFVFYLVFPFLFLLFKKKNFQMIFLFFFISLIFIKEYYISASISIWDRSEIIYYSWAEFLFFFFGMSFALSYKKIHKKLFIYILLLALFPLSIFFSLKVYSISFIINGFIGLFIIYLFLAQQKVFIFNTLLRYLGTISYSFYMFHTLVLRHIIPRFITGHFYTSIILSFCLTILFSILTYNVIEKPFMSLRKKY